MKNTLFCAAISILRAPAILAQASHTTVVSATTSATPTCTASLITSLCDYPSPGPEFAVAIESRASCWSYCSAHPPCDFVIFSAGNPSTGTGTCWLYPGKTFDASAGSSNCGNPSLSVYNKPVCVGGSPTSGACAATASPSAVASVCGYPPPDDCFETCVASTSASSCLSQCAKAESCSYVVFNPRNPSNSPYASGTCWMYRNGTYDAGSVTTCSGKPEQFVYHNVCPKPTPSLFSSLSSSPTAATNGDQAVSVTKGPSSGSESQAPSKFSFHNFLISAVSILMQQILL
jgi:hypothetical protein